MIHVGGGGGGERAQELNPQLMHDIQVLVSRLVSKAGQLIHNLTTNLAENWMHIWCKFVGGTVVNRIQSGSWESRCYGAGLEKNLRKSWGPQMWERVMESSANGVFIDSAERRVRKLENDRKRKATDAAKESRRQNKYSKKDNSDISNDVSQGHLMSLKQTFFDTKVKVDQEAADRTECDRKDQSHSDQWMKEREKCITAS